MCMIATMLFLLPFAESMSEQEVIELREESKDMFYHAYNAYLFNAFPADEPLLYISFTFVRGPILEK